MVNDTPAGCVRSPSTDEDGSIWRIYRLGVLHMALYPEHEHLANFYAIFDFNIAPELEFSLHDSLPPPVMLRKLFD